MKINFYSMALIWIVSISLLGGKKVMSQTAQSLHLELGNYITATNPNLPQGNTARTIEVWAKETNSGNTGLSVLANYGTSGNNTRASLMFYLNRIYLVADFNDSYAEITRDNSWHHYAATYDGTTLKLYMDGALLNQHDKSQSPFNTTGTTLDIGRKITINSEFFHGHLDELRIWNYARSAAEISQTMNTELTGNEAGLVAYYNFNQGTPNADNSAITTLNDLSTSNADGTLVGFTLNGLTSNWSDEKPANLQPLAKSLHLEPGNYITASNPNLPQGNTARTIEVWAKETNSGNTGLSVLANYGTPTNNQRSSLMLINNNLSYVGEFNDFSVAITRDNDWHLYAATYDGTILKLYMDGVFLSQKDMSISPFNTNGSALEIGRKLNGLNGGEYLHGHLDELRIWNYARSAAEISQTMNTELTGNEAGLVAYYNFNQGTPNADNSAITTLNDLSTSNADGTLVGFTLNGLTSNWSDEQPSSFLPVTYLHFRGNATEAGHRLQWATGTEDNNEGFQIERSRDGHSFTPIGWVSGAGTTQERQDYTYLDTEPFAGVTYYRLQQVDYDGTTAYSEVVTVVRNAPAHEVQLYPNPVTDQLTIQNAAQSIVTFYNMLGQPVHQQAIPHTPYLMEVHHLPRGHYTVTIQHADGRRHTQTLVK